MIRHRNYYAMVAVVDELPDHSAPGDVMLLYLPLAHNFGRLMHLSGPYVGYTIAFVADPLDVARVLPEVRPTILPSVPRVYEKVHTAVTSTFAEARARSGGSSTGPWTSGAASHLRQQGRPLPRTLALQHRLADRLVFSKVKERLGGRLRRPISEARRWRRRSPSCSTRWAFASWRGTGSPSARPPPRRTGRIATGSARSARRYRASSSVSRRTRARDPLETIFAGYFKEPEATAAVLDDDGWLQTGDIATIDEDGFVTITDRKKDIIVTAGGKNIAPQNLENDLKTSQYVSQVMVVGDRRPFPAALITLDPVEIGKWAAEQGIEGDAATLARDARVEQLVSGIVDEVNRDRSRYEQLKRFRILPRDFEMEQGEVTPTLKLKRNVVLEHFADEVDALYDGAVRPDA